MEMAEMMECLLARMNANMKTMLAKMDANQAKADASHKEILAKIEANGKVHLKAMKGMMDAFGQTMACQGKTKARLGGEEPTSVDMEPEAAQRQVLREDAAVIPVRGPKKRHRDRNPEARRRGKTKERTQGKDGAGRNWPSPAEGRPAVRKWYGARKSSLDKIEQGSTWYEEPWKRRTFRKKRQQKQERKKG
jgi:hypothetical protein